MHIFSRPSHPQTFKFRDLNGDLHKLHLPSPPTLSALHGLITPHFPAAIKLKYTDPEGDTLLLSTDHQLSICLQDTLTTSTPTSVFLHIIPHTPTSPPSLPSPPSTISTASTPPPSPPPPSHSLRTSSPSRFQRRFLKANLRVFHRALQLDHGNVRALRGRADLYLRHGEWEQAREDYERILEIGEGGGLEEGEKREVRRGVVLALVGAKKYREAVRFGTGGLEVEEEVWLGRVLKERLDVVAEEAMGVLEAGKFRVAVELYGEALEVEDMYVAVGYGRRKRSLRVGRAMANEALERVRLALADYREVVDMGGELIGWKGCGRCLLEIGELKEAGEMYAKVLKREPTCEEAIEKLGLIEQLRKEMGGAWAGEKGRVVEWWQGGSRARA